MRKICELDDDCCLESRIIDLTKNGNGHLGEEDNINGYYSTFDSRYICTTLQSCM